MPVRDEINKLRLRKLKLLSDHQDKIKKLQRDLDERLWRLDKLITEAADSDGALPCLVRRTPGPDLTVYHAADGTCKRVRDRQNFEPMMEKDAVDASPWTYLERCSACAWELAAHAHGQRLVNGKGGTAA